ncbi:hypothetical protein C5O80_25025 [Burkholderia sp. SRS-46]|nr:hypothetical protein C5O80_25025 [Burkholderia sp. SRS-46]
MPRFQWLMRDGARTRCHRNVIGHSSGRPRGAFQSVVESKAGFLLCRRQPLAPAAGVMLRSPFSPLHGSSMSDVLRSHALLAAVAAGARAAGLKLKKRLLD